MKRVRQEIPENRNRFLFPAITYAFKGLTASAFGGNPPAALAAEAISD